MKSMRQQLLLWLLPCIVLGSILITALVYRNAKAEVDELYNAHLQQIATLLARQLSGSDLGKINPPRSSAKDSGFVWKEEHYLIQVWDQSGRLREAVAPVADAASIRVPLEVKVGFHRRDIDGQTWLVFRADGDNLIVQIAQPEATRSGTINESILQVLLPLILQVPILAVLVWFAARRGLRPLDQLSRDIAERQPGALTPLNTALLPVDLQALASALNDLLARLDRTLQQQRNFVADAAHELRTPIAVLQLQLDLLKRATTTGDRDLALSALSKGVQRATLLIQQLLQIARSEATPSDEMETDIALERAAVEAIERHLPMARLRDIDLGVTSLAAVGIHAAAADVDVVLDNLLSNALRYTPPGGKIDVAIRCADRQAIIDVIDNGVGIPEAERVRIFDRFYRLLLPHTENVSADGSGLGLAIVKSICERYGATIAVAAGPDNKGSLFRVSWPTQHARQGLTT